MEKKCLTSAQWQILARCFVAVTSAIVEKRTSGEWWWNTGTEVVPPKHRHRQPEYTTSAFSMFFRMAKALKQRKWILLCYLGICFEQASYRYSQSARWAAENRQSISSIYYKQFREEKKTCPPTLEDVMFGSSHESIGKFPGRHWQPGRYAVRKAKLLSPPEQKCN